MQHFEGALEMCVSSSPVLGEGARGGGRFAKSGCSLWMLLMDSRFHGNDRDVY